MRSTDPTGHRRSATRRARDLAAAVHELRTPLATVQGFLETLHDRDDELDPDLRRQMTAIALRNAQVLGQRIDGLLAFERLEGGEGLQVASASLHDALVRLVEDCAGILANHDVALEVPADTWVAVDIDGLAHVVANLLANAVRHSPVGSTITIVADAADADVAVAVVDQGEGIPEEALPRVFEAFYRGGEHPGAGTGLGLAVVRRYVDRWGGQVDIESTLGQGTRVTFTLPRVPAGGAADQHAGVGADGGMVGS